MVDRALLPLRGDRAVLRPMTVSDARPYATGTEDPHVRRYAHLPEPEYTEESVAALVEGAVREGLERGDLAVLTIADPATDEFAGSLVLFGVAGESVEVGFWVHPDHRGRGMAAAALALASVLAARSGFTRITARTVPENEASRRVLAAGGFVRGERTADVAPSGHQVELEHYIREVEEVPLHPVRTRRLRLRLHQHGDQARLHAIYRQQDVAQYLLEEPWTLAEATNRVQQRMCRTGLDGGTSSLALIIEYEGTPIGDVLLWLVDVERRVAEIGWVLDPGHGGRGLAREAVAAVLDLAFDRYRLHRVVAQMDARNTASAALAAAVGMRHEAHLRQDWWNKGEWTDTLVFGMLSTDR